MNNNNKSVTFVYGSDDFLVDRRARIIYDAMCGGHGEIIPLDNTNNLLNAIEASKLAISSISLFKDSDNIWLQSACFFSDASLSAEKKEAIESLFDSIKSDHGKKIIVSASSVDKRTKLFKDFSKISETIDVDVINGQDGIESIIQDFCRQKNFSIDDASIKLLVLKCGNNCRLVQQEIDKLSTYLLGESDKISENDVMDMVDTVSEGNFFEPIEKFFENDLSGTLTSLDRYFFHNDDARPILSAFQSRNRILIQLKYLLDSKRLKISYGNISQSDFVRTKQFYHVDDFEKTTFNIFSQNIWYLNKLLPACLKFEFFQFLRFQILLTETFHNIIKYPNSQKMIIKKLVIQCLNPLGASKFQ